MRGGGTYLTGRVIFKTTAKSILKTSIVFNSPEFIPQTPSLALIPLLTALHTPAVPGELAPGHPLSLLCRGGWPAPLQPGAAQGEPKALGGGTGDVAWPGELALQKKSIKRLPQAQINLRQSSKPPQHPPAWGPSAGRYACWSCPGCSGRYPEQHRQGTVLSRSPLCFPEPPTSRHCGGLAQTSCCRPLPRPPLTLGDVVTGMLFSPAK